MPSRPDVGFTHIALPVSDLDASIAFYEEYTRMRVVHRRQQRIDPDREIAWLSDLTRPFVLVLSEREVENPLRPFAHLGVACGSREEVDALCERARSEGRLREGPRSYGGPAGYLAFIDDPDGHTLELSHGQETWAAVDRAKDEVGDSNEE